MNPHPQSDEAPAAPVPSSPPVSGQMKRMGRNDTARSARSSSCPTIRARGLLPVRRALSERHSPRGWTGVPGAGNEPHGSGIDGVLGQSI